MKEKSSKEKERREKRLMPMPLGEQADTQPLRGSGTTRGRRLSLANSLPRQEDLASQRELEGGKEKATCLLEASFVFLSLSLAQGRQEAALGLPFSPLCDERTADVPQSQAGFLRLLCKPLFAEVADVDPSGDMASVSGVGIKKSRRSLAPTDGQRVSLSVRRLASEGLADLFG